MSVDDNMVKEVLKIVGGAVPLARKLGVTHQYVYKWKRIPLSCIFQIEELTGIDREYLRPDIYRPRTKPKGKRQVART